MRKSLTITFVMLILCLYFASAQKLTEPKLVGSWVGGEDFGEFIFHKTEELNYYIKENPNSKIVARICSKDLLPLALMNSIGFAFQFISDTRNQNIPDNQVYLARSSNCIRKSKITFEQYWVVPENSSLENDEIIPADKVEVKRFLVNYYENYESQPAKNEFNGYIKKFIKSLKDNPKSEGFIVSKWNSRKTNRNIQKVLQQVKQQQVDISRVKVVRKQTFYDLYPELFTITIQK